MLATRKPRNSEVQTENPPKTCIVFFDGVCGLCDSMVNFLILRDRKHCLRYAPLQGETAAKLLPEEERRDLRYMLFQDERGLCRKS
ncbi:MAG: DCC1-like thiol-disulfide oxidoreductase family protein, partial [Planctomycetales bacterium]